MRSNGSVATAVAAPPRAVSYCRVSTDRQAQEGVSLDVQRAACQEFAQAQGWMLQGEYVDDESSYSPRQQYQAMLHDAVDGKIDLVLVYDFGRFGRDIAQTPADFARLEALGIKVVAVSSPHAGRLERNIQFVLNDFYSYELGRKVKPSHIQRVQAGLWVSRPPVGYRLAPIEDVKPGRKVAKYLVPDLDQAPKVRRLFELYATGVHSLNSLAREADSMGLLSHTGRPIARSNIANILRNPVYIGQVVYNRRSLSKFEKKGPRPPSEWVHAKGRHEPLIDEATFERCAKLLGQHQVSYGPLTKGRTLLTGVLFCAQCGSKMVGRPRWKRTGKHHDGPGRYWYITYECYRARTFRNCANASIYGGRNIEEYVKGQIKRLPITQEERVAAQAEAKRILSESTGDVSGQQKALLDQRDAHIADLKALSWRLVRNEIPTPLYAEMRAEKEAQLAVLDEELERLTEHASVEADAKEILAFLETVTWEDLDTQAWKEAIAVLIRRVVFEARHSYRIEWQPGVEPLLRSE